MMHMPEERLGEGRLVIGAKTPVSPPRSGREGIGGESEILFQGLDFAEGQCPPILLPPRLIRDQTHAPQGGSGLLEVSQAVLGQGQECQLALPSLMDRWAS